MPRTEGGAPTCSCLAAGWGEAGTGAEDPQGRLAVGPAQEAASGGAQGPPCPTESPQCPAGSCQQTPWRHAGPSCRAEALQAAAWGGVAGSLGEVRVEHSPGQAGCCFSRRAAAWFARLRVALRGSLWLRVLRPLDPCRAPGGSSGTRCPCSAPAQQIERGSETTIRISVEHFG